VNKPNGRIRGRYRLSTYLSVLPRLNSILHLMARILPGGFSLRPALHRLRGVKIGENVWIGDDVYIDEDHPEAIEIQDGAAVATRCTIIGHTKGPGRIIIEKDAAVGAGCIIVCAFGQTLRIGEGAVISAGSTVSHDIAPFTLCGAPRIRAFGRVTIPFRHVETYEEFRRAVEPMRAKNGRGVRA
jgi:UDP-3-O-[3-hydroxymyristoyl] glucosamine N-acyltransferase